MVQIDDKLINSLECGLPICSGVAMGIERLIMAIEEINHINNLNLSY